MIEELHRQIDSGASNDSIFKWFENKYGAPVLAAPIRGGFDDVAWIVPIAGFLLATLGTGILIRMWKLRGGRQTLTTAAASPVGTDALRERIRRETEY
jgi:cytochrome c-type biogenesis protein CcmH